MLKTLILFESLTNVKVNTPSPIFSHRKNPSEILGLRVRDTFFLHGPQDVKSTELKALQSLLTSGDATGGTGVVDG